METLVRKTFLPNYQMRMLKYLPKIKNAYQLAIYSYLMAFYQENSFKKYKVLKTSYLQLQKELELPKWRIIKAINELASDEIGMINLKVIPRKGIEISTTLL